MSKKPKAQPPFADKGLYEVESEPTAQELEAMTNWEKIIKTHQKLVGGLDCMPLWPESKIAEIKTAHPLLAELEKSKTAAQRKAAQAAIDADGLAIEIQKRIARFEDFDAKGYDVDAFRAGFEFAFAYLLANAGANARHGKRMNSKGAAARPRKKRNTNPLKVAVLKALQDYKADAKGKPVKKTEFVRWLHRNAGTYDIKSNRWQLSIGGSKWVMEDTVRKWVK